MSVYGPPGVERVVEGFNRAYDQDVGYRVAHQGPEVVPPSGAGARARVFPMPAAGRPRVVFDGDGVDHGLPRQPPSGGARRGLSIVSISASARC